MLHIKDFSRAFWVVTKWTIPVLLATVLFTGIIFGLLLGVLALIELVAPGLKGPVEAWCIILGVVVPLAIFVYGAYLAAHRALADMDKHS